MSTLINLVGTRLEIQEYLHNGNLTAARNLITNRMIAPRLLSQWLTPAQRAAIAAPPEPIVMQQAHAAPPPIVPMAQLKREVAQLALELV